MRFRIGVADSLPGSSVALSRLRVTLILFILFIYYLFMLLAVPAVSKLLATGIGTRLLGFSWHLLFPSKKKSPKGLSSRARFHFRFSLIIQYHICHMDILGQMWTFRAFSYFYGIFRKPHMVLVVSLRFSVALL